MLYSYGFDDKQKINELFDDPLSVSSLPIISLWISLLSRVVDNSKGAQEYIYKKLFTNYLLKMLFYHENITSIEVMFLKKNICTLLFKLCSNENNLSSLLKYHYDLRHIYEYTIKITKTQLLRMIESNELLNFFKNKGQFRFGKQSTD